jgi:excinuclease ABC subunit A
MSKNYACPFACALPVERDLAKIIVHGAREHNLKNICFEIPKGKLIALTGPSGSGKSSIAVEVLQKECLRQYLESLGMTTDHIAKVKVDHIMGLSPAIGVSQRVTDFNPRSTVGTKTGILTIIRNLFASIGRQTCAGCGKLIKQPLQDKNKLTTIEIEKADSSAKKKTKSYFDCPNCGLQLEKLEMAHFSFNAAVGACETCKGMGEIIGVDISRLINEEKTIKDGGVSFWDVAVAEHYESVIQSAAKHYNFSLDTSLPIRDYTKEQRNFLLYGVTFPEFLKAHKNIKEPKKVSDGKFEGLIPYLLSRYKSNPHKLPNEIKKYISRETCCACHNARLGKIGREVAIHGKTIIDVAGLNLSELLEWIHALESQVSEDESQVLASLSHALKERTSNVIEVGLDYLTLDRSLPSLSAGESQRLRLACVLGSGLTGVLYILDEPTTGLHPHDTKKLLSTLRRIQEAGNTVLVIEHDLDIIREVDYIVEMGPGRGNNGGQIVMAGTPAEVKACSTSITGKYLARKAIGGSNTPRSSEGKVLSIRGSCEHNLKNVDVSIPVNQFVVMTGVSGSGKSTLLFDILDKAARKYFNHASTEPGKHVSIEGLNYFHRVVTVDQVTIRNTQSSRSNVATYTKLFDSIRDLLASTPDAKIRGFGADKFSFNTSDERCKNCNGAGLVAIDMAFMPDVETKCPICNGMRFNEELLSVKFNGNSIADILDMTASDAMTVFRGQQNIFVLLDLMKQVGLDYLTLGQSTSTLSGGEAQRIKLVAELSKSGKESTLYLLDEPTTGLHPQEVEKLLLILKRLVSRGNTVVIIEHHLDAISEADVIIDFGPGGGSAGGKIVAISTPQELAANKNSLTGQSLKAYLGL